MSDPVAAKSTFLSTYMSNHPDTLVAYVVNFTKNFNVASATLKSIDSNGMDLSYKLKAESTTLRVRIPFDPPLSGYEEVRPRLLAMKVDAEESLRMTKTPVIKDFVVPWGRMLYGPTIPQIFLTWFTFSSAYYADLARSFVGPRILIASWGFLVILHTAECLYAAYLCRKHHTGVLRGVAWSLGTFTFGYPFLSELRSKIHTARVQSITKVE